MARRKDQKGRILREGETQREDGRYEYRYYDVNGNRKSIYSWKLTATDPLPEGKRACIGLREMERDILRDVRDGVLTQHKITLNDRWSDYISNKYDLKPSTKGNYCYMYDKFVRNEIGKANISLINYSMIRRYFNHLVFDLEMEPGTATIIYTLLHPVFNVAVRDGLIRSNPTNGVIAELKKITHWEQPQKHGLTEAQQRVFIDYLNTHVVKYKNWTALFICLLGTGCRISEMLSLRWEDIYWEENLISINHSIMFRIRGQNGDIQRHVTTPKTRSGIRVIPMFRSVRKALQDEYDRQKETGFCQEVIDGYSGFIWQSKTGKLLQPHTVNHKTRQIINNYNREETINAEKEGRIPFLLPYFSVHQLRHTFCIRLCERESDLKLIQEIMGHSNISTTMNVYNESNTDRKKKSFSRIEELYDVF